MKLKRDEPSAEIPASSMADIAFLLIIYFMVTTTFAATRGLDFALPKEDDTPPVIEKEDSVLIEIRPDGQTIVDQKPMAIEGILPYLQPKLANNPRKPVIIRPDDNAPYGHMVQVFDALRQGKIIGGNLVWDRDAFSKEEFEQGKDINVSIPTRREIESFWY